MKTRLFALTIVLAIPACDGSSSGDGATSPTPGTTSAPVVTASAPPPAVSSAAPAGSVDPKAAVDAVMKKGERGHGFGPVGMLLSAARDEATLKDAQKAELDKIEASLKPADAGPPKEMKDVHDAMLAGVRAGKLDTAKIDAAQAAMEKSMAAHQEKEAAALTALHKLLDPAQRKAVVAAIRAKQAARDEKMAARKANSATDKDDYVSKKLVRMQRELDLDETQKKSVQALLEKDKPAAGGWDAMRAEMKKRNDALLTAFEADAFDAKKVDLTMPGKPKDMMKSRVAFVTGLLGILKPEQREKLATSMEKPMGRHRHPGSMPPAAFEESGGSMGDALE
jgi:Spy/CpxP family protein refolding chaperone